MSRTTTPVVEATLEEATEGIAQQDVIRRFFLSGATRAQIHKALGIRYQIVYKATNPEFAPKELKAAIDVELAQERANRLEALGEQFEARREDDAKCKSSMTAA